MYAADVLNARQMAAGPDGFVFVGRDRPARLRGDRSNGDGQADQVHVPASGLNHRAASPSATALLYVAAVNRYWEIRDADRKLDRAGQGQVGGAAPSSDAHHAGSRVQPTASSSVPSRSPWSAATGPLHCTSDAQLAGGAGRGRGARVATAGLISSQGQASSGSPTTPRHDGRRSAPGRAGTADAPGRAFGIPFRTGPTCGPEPTGTDATGITRPAARPLVADRYALLLRSDVPEPYRGGSFIAEHGSYGTGRRRSAHRVSSSGSRAPTSREALRVEVKLGAAARRPERPADVLVPWPAARCLSSLGRPGRTHANQLGHGISHPRAGRAPGATRGRRSAGEARQRVGDGRAHRDQAASPAPLAPNGPLPVGVLDEPALQRGGTSSARGTR